MSTYRTFEDEISPEQTKESSNNVMPIALPLNFQMRKYFKTFYKKKTFNKLHSFVEWVEISKPPQGKTVYNQIKDFQYNEDIALVVQHEAEVICMGISVLNQTLAVGLINGVVNLIHAKTGSYLAQIKADEIKVNSLILSDHYLYTGGDNQRVCMWRYMENCKNISQEYAFEGHSDIILSMAIIPNDRFVISGDANGEVYIWNIEEKSNRNFVVAVGFAINALVVTPDANKIISADSDNKIKIWNFADLSLSHLFEGHEGRVLALAISRDGEKLASAGGDKQLKIWDLRQKIELFSLEGHEDEVNCLVFLRGGKTILSGSKDNSLKIWSVNKGLLKTTLEGHGGSVKCLAINQKTLSLISGSEDQTVRAWKTKQSPKQNVLIGSKAPVLSLAAIPKTPYIISGGKESVIRIWNLEKAAKIVELDANTTCVLSLDVNHEGTKFVSGGIDGSITIWEIDLKKLQFNKIATVLKHLEGVFELKFTRNGDNIISASFDQCIKIWDLTLQNELRDLKNHLGISAMGISPDDCQIITGSKSSGLYIWDFYTLKNISILQGHQGEITCIKVTPDYKLISSSQDCTIKIWNLFTKKLIRSLEMHEKPVLSLEVLTDKNKIISGSEDQTLRIWDIETGEQIGIVKNYTEPITTMIKEYNDYRVISNGNNDFKLKIVDINNIKTIKILSNYEKSLNAIVISPDQKLLATGSDNYCIKIWDLLTWKAYPELKSHVGIIYALKFTEDCQKLISCGSDNSARVWDLKNLNAIQMIKTIKGFSNSVHAIEFFDDEKKAAFACYDNTITFVDMERYETIGHIYRHMSKVICLAVNRDDQILYSGSKNKKILVSSLKDIEYKFELGQHDGAVNCLMLTRYNDKLISGSDDHTIKIWNLKENKLINTMRGHNEAVKCLLINSNASKLFSGSVDKTIRIWDLNKYKQLAILDGAFGSVNSIAINSDNTRLYSASTDKTVRVWDVDDSRKYPFCEGHFNKIKRIDATPDGKYLISVSNDMSVIIWDIKEGRQKTKLKGYKGSVKALALTSDGSKIVTGTYDNCLFIWDLRKEIVIAYKRTGQSSYCLVLSQDDKEVIVACTDSIIRVYDIETLVVLRKFEDGHCSNIFRVILSPDGKKLLSSGEDKLIVVWNYQTTEKILTLEGHTDSVFSLALIKNKDMKLISGSKDNTLRVWNFETGANEKIIEGFKSQLKDIIVTADNKTAIIGCKNKSIHIYDIASWTEIQKLDGVTFEVMDILLTSDEKHLYAGGEKTIGIWNFTTGNFEKSLTGFSSEIMREILSPDKKMICFATIDNVVTVWDFIKGFISKHQAHTKEVTALILTSNNKTLISASKDKTIVLFSIDNSRIIKRIKCQGAINALALTKSEDTLISACGNNTIKLWTFPICIKKREFKTYDDNILTIETISSNQFLTGGTEKKLNLWDMITGQSRTLFILQEKIQGLMLSPDGHILLVFLSNYMMQIWNIQCNSMINQLKIRENLRTFPVFLSQTNSRLMLYFDQIIDCCNGEIIFKFETNREMISFFFEYSSNSYFYITPEFELFKLQNYWLQTYIFEYLKYDSITVLNKDPEYFINRPGCTYPFFLSFLHLITIFENTESFTSKMFEEIYAGNVQLNHFFSQDIFMKTPLDIMIMKKNTTLMNKYFNLFFEYFDKENASFFQKARFLKYSFRKDYDILNLMSDIIDLCTPDFSIISRLLDRAFIPLDLSIYDNSLFYKELDDEPILISTDSLYMTGKVYIEEKLREILNKPISKVNQNGGKVKRRKNKENESMVKAKVICIPGISDICNVNTQKIFLSLADCDHDNEIFNNKTLIQLTHHIWSSQIKNLYLADFLFFFLFFLLYNINFIVLYPLKVNIFYNDAETLRILNISTSIIDMLLTFYAFFSLINEIRQMYASGFVDYFKSFWNYFDILLIPLLILSAYSDYYRTTTELSSSTIAYIKLASAVCMFCFWFRLLSFSRAMTKTSSMMCLILHVITSTKYFLLFMLIFMLALSTSFYLLHNDHQDENPELWTTFLVFYSTTIGDTSGITEYDSAFSELSDFFMIASTFIFAIILLNLLVSIIGDIHEEIKENEVKTRQYELVNIIVDTNFALTTQIIRLFRRKEKQRDYLIQLYNEKHEEKEVNVYEALEKRMGDKITGIYIENERILDEKIEKIFLKEWGKVRDYLEKSKK